MNIEEFRTYCINKKGVTEGFPFDETTLVFKVYGKMFALCDVDDFDFVNLKSDPEEAIELREKYSGVKPGYHMSKKHWNSVYVNKDVDDSLFYQLIDQSYNLVYMSLPKKLRDEVQGG